MFSHPALLWFLTVLGAVVVIHIINLRRHKQIPWAAMEFILAAHKRSRTRIQLQQLLLLLLRLAAVAALVLMFADLKVGNTLASWFGDGSAHCVFLLDDSFSMNDRDTELSAASVFDEGVKTIRNVIAEKRSGAVTLLTSSKTSNLYNIPLDTDGRQTIENVLSKLKPSNLATEPETLFSEGVEVVRQNQSQYKSEVFFLSDFRRRNWLEIPLFLQHIEAVRQCGGQVRMIRLTDTQHANLSVERLELSDGIHTAEVEMLLEAVIANWSDDAAENVTAEIYVDEKLQSQHTVAAIPAGGKTEPPLRLPFRISGNKPDAVHQIELRLQSDAVPNDNSRYLTLQVPDVINVLLVSPKTSDVRDNAVQYVRSALSPSGVKSGIRTRSEAAEFLVQPDALSNFQVIFLLDAAPMEPAAVKALEQFVADGGGLVIFTGENSNVDFIRQQLYKTGNGLFPVAPIAERELPPDFLSQQPDIKAAQHPVFRLFFGEDNALLAKMTVDKYLGSEQPLNGVSIPAALRNGEPLVLEKEYGKGRTVTFLTSASPTWNNWGRSNPGYVVMLLDLAAYLTKAVMVKNDMNVDSSEGDIRLASVTELADALRTIHQSVENVNDFQIDINFVARRSVSDWLLVAVLLLLVGETLLAGRMVR
ncbi:hypothetical protein FACS1894170_00580 [Planctomycetales bacterium]|nr:hypothetical protein FACS1894170_00580 [Planctomycetales bacterium]